MPAEQDREPGIFEPLAPDRPRRMETHGAATLELVDGMPIRATSCGGPDGLTDAERIKKQAALDIWTRRLANGLWRRGRIEIEPGVEIRFVDEPRRDGAVARPPLTDLALDLRASTVIREKVRSEVYATLLYAALCNTIWTKNGVQWNCG